MEEFFQTLVENEILTEDTRAAIVEEFNNILAEAKEEAREEAIVEAKAEMAKRYVEEREALIEAIDTKSEEILRKELAELHESIDSFRDLEAEYNERLVESRKQIAEEVRKDFETLVEKVDSFVEMRLTAELEELKESIEDARRVEYGRRIVDALQESFMEKFVDVKGMHDKMTALQESLKDKQSEMQRLQESIAQLEREKTMAEVLSPLHGRPREIMEAILENTPTEKLEEAYKTFIPRVLHESVDDSESERETNSTVPADDKASLKESESTNDKNELLTEGTKVVTGDKPALKESESTDDKSEVKDEIKELRRRLQILSGTST